ncbi:vacuolar membrane protein [Phlyctema vagabunda]|uniref:Vacuolar membrane protein n=1 Tax=Phlyctema vagabunda TaxID=108571 RepID=A0ABR4PEM1_9HELO
MGCSGRVKQADIRPEQKWDFISLNDFKSTSCFEPFAYGYLYISLLISIAVYAVDTFTAVNLLAFNKWSGEIEPSIPLDVSKWIFSACIIASWVNLGFEYVRAIRVMKRGAVAESYLDSLAVRLQCIRIGETGRGWRRFLVFAELTKSKKGAEYVALFTYFSFQAWIRVIFCSGPRQVINALTLWSVFEAKLDPSDTDDVGGALVQFFKNIGILASSNQQQAVILSGMVFTLVIWIFAVLSLFLALLFYLFFLWHYIPNADGGLGGYCERKINSRLQKIVSVKINKALAEEERRTKKAAAKASKTGEVPAIQGRQATLPTLFDAKSEDKLPNMPMLDRNDTMTTLPMYSSRPGTPSGQPALPAFELSQLDQQRPFPSRTTTGASTASYASNAPLMGNASEMGYGRSASPAPSLPQLNTNNMGPQRTMTSNSNNSQWSAGPQSQPPRMPSAMGREFTASPVSYNDGPNGISPASNGPPRNLLVDGYGRPLPRAVADLGGRSMTPVSEGRYSPAPGSQMGRSSPAPPFSPAYSNGSAPSLANGYNPGMRSASAAPQQPTSAPAPYRNMTDPSMRGPPQGGDYFGNAPPPPILRPGTASSQRSMNGPGFGGPGFGGPPRMGSPASFNGRPGQQGGYRQ